MENNAYRYDYTIGIPKVLCLLQIVTDIFKGKDNYTIAKYYRLFGIFEIKFSYVIFPIKYIKSYSDLTVDPINILLSFIIGFFSFFTHMYFLIPVSMIIGYTAITHELVILPDCISGVIRIRYHTMLSTILEHVPDYLDS